MELWIVYIDGKQLIEVQRTPEAGRIYLDPLILNDLNALTTVLIDKVIQVDSPITDRIISFGYKGQEITHDYKSRITFLLWECDADTVAGLINESGENIELTADELLVELQSRLQIAWGLIMLADTKPTLRDGRISIGTISYPTPPTT